jgi:hypothetical protein
MVSINPPGLLLSVLTVTVVFVVPTTGVLIVQPVFGAVQVYIRGRATLGYTILNDPVPVGWHVGGPVTKGGAVGTKSKDFDVQVKYDAADNK